MLARRSPIVFESQVIAETPLLVPSFSSKGLPKVKQIMNLMSEFITGPILVSAYDVHYKLVPRTITFPKLIFLDSGGYEARIEHDLSEVYGKLHRPMRWTQRFHEDVLSRWAAKLPTIAVSYDSPGHYVSLAKQIKGAGRLQKENPHFLWELLLKPPTTKDGFVPIEDVITRVDQLRGFAAIGVTEKELSDSSFGAMTKVARLRKALDTAKSAMPIHIFGSLDTLNTVLMFVAGADIFDGLTWLRFGYHEGMTLYPQNYGTIKGSEGLRRRTEEQFHEMWRNNYYYLEKLRTQMINFVRTDGDFKCFGPIEEVVRDAWTQLEATVAEMR